MTFRRALLFLLGFAVGCQGSNPPAQPVEGTLLVAGHPVEGAHLLFTFLDSVHPPTAQCTVGITDAKGRFVLTTYAYGDGAPEGDYIVTFFWPHESFNEIDPCDCPAPIDHDRLRGQYMDPKTSPLRATIHPGINRIVIDAPVGPLGWYVPKVVPQPKPVDARPDWERERDRLR